MFSGNRMRYCIPKFKSCRLNGVAKMVSIKTNKHSTIHRSYLFLLGLLLPTCLVHPQRCIYMCVSTLGVIIDCLVELKEKGQRCVQTAVVSGNHKTKSAALLHY